MYRLFQRIPKGLEPVAESFRKHVEGEGMKLVKEATEAATAKKDKDAGKPSKDSGLPALPSHITNLLKRDMYVQSGCSYPAMTLLRQLVDQRFVIPSPLIQRNGQGIRPGSLVMTHHHLLVPGFSLIATTAWISWSLCLLPLSLLALTVLVDAGLECHVRRLDC